MNTTIVSSYINLPHNKSRNIIEYEKLILWLIQKPIPKILFLDESLWDRLWPYQNSHTVIFKTSLNDLYLLKYKDEVNFNPITDNPTKDSIEYFSIMNNKTEWVREAIKLNPFSTQNFVWLDAGIRHVLNENTPLDKLNSSYDKVRIGRIWDLNIPPSPDFHRKINWYLAGGVFGGTEKRLLQFADLCKEKNLELVNKKIITWEVNTWYDVVKSNPELFSLYQCNHNESIVTNF